MTAIVRKSVGAFHVVFNAANQPSPGAFGIGDAVLVLTGEFLGSDTITTPSGFTKLSPGVNANQCSVFGLISLTGSETMPTISWGNQFAWAIVLVYSNATLTVDYSQDRAGVTTQSLIGPTSGHTPSMDGCVNILVVTKNKTSTSNATVVSAAPTNFTMVGSNTGSGTNSFVGICDWIQTTATAVPGNLVMAGTVADSTNQSFESVVLALQPSPAPPPAATDGMVPQPGSPSLAGPSNPFQFHGIAATVAQAPPIPAPITGLWASSSLLSGALISSVPNIGFIPQPGPGNSGPFNHNQFLTVAGATDNPSPTTANIFGQWASSSVFYGGNSSAQAGALFGIQPSSSLWYAPLQGLNAGTMFGYMSSSSAWFGSVTGTGALNGLLPSSSLISALQVGGSFQPLVPMSAVVDVRLGIGYQPWKVHPEGGIG